jgi:acetyl-CoA carboxylase biotin carboxyl carrier protein
MTTNEQTDRKLNDVTIAVRELADIMNGNGLSKIDVAVGDISIRLRAGGSRKVVVSSKSDAHAGSPEPIIETEFDRGFLITAPMIGTYYTSPAPGEPEFVHIGERIEAGQIIGIIEAMKIMNEIPAERGGIVVEILAGNAQAVEYGSPLLRIAQDEFDE